MFAPCPFIDSVWKVLYWSSVELVVPLKSDGCRSCIPILTLEKEAEELAVEEVEILFASGEINDTKNENVLASRGAPGCTLVQVSGYCISMPADSSLKVRLSGTVSFDCEDKSAIPVGVFLEVVAESDACDAFICRELIIFSTLGK